MHQSFATAAQELLDSESDLAQKYPHLHQGLSWRLQRALADRNHEVISMCDDVMFHGYEIGRNDEYMFQNEEYSAMVDFLDPIVPDDTATRPTQICKKLSDRVEIYGTLGYGSKSLQPPLPYLGGNVLIYNRLCSRVPRERQMRS